MNHLIRTQVIDVVFHQEAEAFALQQRLRDLFYEVLLPVLEEAFDELSTPQEVIHLDTVELDLGTVSLADLEMLDITDQLKSKIRVDLTAVILSPAGKKTIKRTLRLSIVQQWMYYMQHGFLPWNVTVTDVVWYDQVLEGFAVDSHSIEALRKLITTDLRAVKRMVLSGAPQFLVHLTEALTSRVQDGLLIVLDGICAALIEAGREPSLAWQRNVWNEILRMAAIAPGLTTDEIVSRVIAHHIDDEMVLLVQRSKTLSPEIIMRVTTAKTSQAAAAEAIRSSLKTAPQPDATPAPESDIIPVPTQAPVSVRPPTEDMFVVRAGLVLLHPFLTNLFTYLNLVEGTDFKSLYHRQKALAVLHFLATGSTTYEEHELVVAKILCNHPWEEPVDPAIQLSGDEMHECEELLGEVIARWSILKSTSANTLRTNFLQRGGKLYTMGNEPHLLVEGNMLDVLLDHLPWGIGIIKLPWMKQLLKVEWR